MVHTLAVLRWGKTARWTARVILRSCSTVLLVMSRWARRALVLPAMLHSRLRHGSTLRPREMTEWCSATAPAHQIASLAWVPMGAEESTASIAGMIIPSRRRGRSARRDDH